jgi:hypothetical protein
MMWCLNPSRTLCVCNNNRAIQEETKNELTMPVDTSMKVMEKAVTTTQSWRIHGTDSQVNTYNFISENCCVTCYRCESVSVCAQCVIFCGTHVDILFYTNNVEKECEECFCVRKL